MNKGKNLNNGYNTIEAITASVVSFLLEEGKVIIPELGYLEVKVFPDKRTVLFKATENTSLFLASEGSIQALIYDNVSIPLKEGKVVNLPDVGIFRPMKNGDGSFRISFTISSALRKLLNGEVKEAENEMKKEELPVVPVKTDDEKVFFSPVLEEQRVEKEEGGEEVKKETEEKESEKNKTEYKTEENKQKEKEREEVVISAPRREIRVERKTPSYVRNVSKVGDLVIPQERKKSNRVAKMRGSIAIAVAVVTLIFIVWYFLPEGKNNRDYVSVSGNSKTELTQLHAKTAKSHESIDLPSLAERKYGNRIFWVYIYDANRDKISSPVNIPAGTILRIPNLWEDYKVDVMDSLEIKRAGIFSDITLKQKIQL